jgi:hypothetical protein
LKAFWRQALAAEKTPSSPVQKSSESNDKNTGGNELLPLPPKVEAPLCCVENSSRRDRDETPWWKIALEIIIAVSTTGAFVAAASYAALTYSLLMDNRNQFELANRPWLNAQNMTIGKSVGDGRMQQLISPTGKDLFVDIWQFSFELQNSGHMPAFDVEVVGIIMQGSLSTAMTWQYKAVCGDALPPPTDTGGFGHPLIKGFVFPNTPVYTESGAMSYPPIKNPNEGYGARYLVMCIDYRYGNKPTIHHTKLLYQGNSAEWKAVKVKGVSYYPVETLQLLGTAAD